MHYSLDHLDEYGWMCVAGGLPRVQAQAMQDAVWAALAQDGIDRDRPETWTVERPAHLQRLRREPAFQWRPAEALQAAIAAIVGRDFEQPSDWGSAFIAFPGEAAWNVPDKGWHIDANYRSPLHPAQGVKTLALIGRVEPRGGATQVLSGSHRLVCGWFEKHRPPAEARSAELRDLLRADPYIDALFTRGEPGERIARFMRTSEECDGVKLQVHELTGEAGDVFLMHPLLMHAAAPNNNAEPRMMISGGVTTNMWGWAAD